MSAGIRQAANGLTLDILLGTVPVHSAGTDSVIIASAGATLTAAAHAARTILATAANLTFTLPAGSAMPVGVPIRFKASAIGGIIARAGSDVIRTPAGTVTSLPLNPGAALALMWTGSEWFSEVSVGGPFDMTSYSGADIALNVGESCFYDVSASTSIPLRIATATDQSYEIDCYGTSTAAAAGTPAYLQVNNTDFVNGILLRNVYSANAVAGGANLTNQGRGIYLEVGGASPNESQTKVFTTTARKRGLSSGGSTTTTNGYAYMVMSEMNDTTTVWSSLGTVTLPVSWTGRVRVRRVM